MMYVVKGSLLPKEESKEEKDQMKEKPGETRERPWKEEIIEPGGAAESKASNTASSTETNTWEAGKWEGELSTQFEIESSSGAAIARDSEGSGRGDGREA